MKRIGWVVVSLTTGYVVPNIIKTKKVALQTLRLFKNRAPEVTFDLKPVFIDDSVPKAH